MHKDKEALANSGFRQLVEVQVKQADAYERVYATLVGQQYPDYLILKLAGQHSWQDTLPLLKAEKNLGFKTVSTAGERITGMIELLHLTQYPQRLMFVSYPRHTQVERLRTSPRIPLSCAATMQVQHDSGWSDSLSGQLSDLSSQGIAFHYRGTLPVSLKDEQALRANVSVDVDGDVMTFRNLALRRIECVGPEHYEVGLVYTEKPENLPDVVSRLLLASAPVKALLNDIDLNEKRLDNTLQGESDSVQFSTN